MTSTTLRLNLRTWRPTPGVVVFPFEVASGGG